ncbi:MAG: hypothetical protein O2913_13395, partial [Chloroflexi bacterium]|nr:hypothetical protein [Chloroflexota bacterium]
SNTTAPPRNDPLDRKVYGTGSIGVVYKNRNGEGKLVEFEGSFQNSTAVELSQSAPQPYPGQSVS